MGNTTMIVIGVLVLAAIGGGVWFYFYRKRGLDQMFEEVYIQAQMIPKQKRMSFLLLMFKESVVASKKKSKTPSGAGKFSNPKYLEVQLLQMTNHIKNRPNIKDKNIKRAFQLLDAYLAWEKVKNAKKA